MAIGFVIDYVISNDMKTEFDQSLQEKAGALMSLVTQNKGVMDFDFADELMPEYQREDNPEYFQLYHFDNKLIEKSNSLAAGSLPYVTPEGSELVFENVQLSQRSYK